MKACPISLSPPRAPRRGFALLITITLLAFLVLLLVSLAALTRVETQVASNNQQLSQARQNALLALNIALGQLQKFAGPDQRVTARADILTSYTGSPAPGANGDADNAAQFDTFWRTRNRHWTGVWGNGETNIGYTFNPTQINGRGVTPVALNWLISGNEDAAFTMAPNGRVSSPSTPRFSPNLPVNGLDASATTATALSYPTVTDPVTGAATQAVLLVGPASTSDGTAASATTSFNAGNYVAAPMVTLSTQTANIPGLGSGTAAVPIGRYAWWVGDEGTKARLNLQNGYQQTGTAGEQINSFLVSQRSAVEFMDGAAPFNFTDANVPRVMSSRQLPLLNAGLSGAAKSRFHDLTAHSLGVLSDTYAGGLKKDLTADIADTSASTSYRPADSDPIFVPKDASEANLPTWGQLRSWARTNPNTSGEIVPTPGTTADAGIAPILALASIGLDMWIDADKNVRVALFPVMILANPYPVPIAASRYDVGFKFPANATMSFQTSPPTDPLTWTTVGTLDWGVPELRAGTAAGTASNFIRFTIDGEVIPPGEAHIYRLDNATSESNYAPGVLLRRAPATGPIGLGNHVMLPSTFALPASVITDNAATSYYMRVHLELMARGVNGPAVSSADVVFSREGDLNNQAGWFQSFKMIATGTQGCGFGQRQVINPAVLPPQTTPPTPIPANWQDLPANASRQRIVSSNGVDGWNNPTDAARAAIRMGTAFALGGAYNSNRFGLPNSIRAGLRHGTLRAPFVRANAIDASTAVVTNQAIIGTPLVGMAVTNDVPQDTSGRDIAIFATYSGYAASIAGTYDFASTRYAVLFDVLDSPDRLFSLGQLQHVPFSRYSFHPSYAFANSMGEMRIPRTATFRDGMVVRPGTSTLDPGYDLSWHLNRALWDRTFVSGIPSTWTLNDPLPNSRMTVVQPDASTPTLDELRYNTGANQAYDKAAARLMVNGSFNINSTSEQAWRALLASSAGIPSNTDYAEIGDRVNEILPFPRISHNLSHAAGGPHTGVTTTMLIPEFTPTANPHPVDRLYNGNRGLHLRIQQPASTKNTAPAALVNELARTIVREVRRRGPFLSLADFVNRAPIAGDNGIKGALQAAIDSMNLAQANPYSQWFASMGGALTTNSLTQGTFFAAYASYDKELYIGGPESEIGTDRDAFRLATSFTPKYLTQADVLTRLGPALSPRSDTFTIRTYGESINPVTQVSEGRAWCEAIVQRLPDYVNDPGVAEKHPTDASLTPESRTFGRKFKIVSFRWLTPSEI